MKKVLLLVFTLLLFLGLPLLVNAQGKCIEGDCINGQGTQTYPDGYKYKGQFRNGKPYGQGVVSFPDGFRFEGEVAGFRFIRGTLIFPNGDKFEGEFEEGLYKRGIFSRSDGSKIIGECKNGKLVKGTLIRPDGVKYIGEFKDEQPHGKGTLYDPQGNIIHQGTFENSKPVR